MLAVAVKQVQRVSNRPLLCTVLLHKINGKSTFDGWVLVGFIGAVTGNRNKAIAQAELTRSTYKIKTSVLPEETVTLDRISDRAKLRPSHSDLGTIGRMFLDGVLRSRYQR